MLFRAEFRPRCKAVYIWLAHDFRTVGALNYLLDDRLNRLWLHSKNCCLNGTADSASLQSSAWDDTEELCLLLATLVSCSCPVYPMNNFENFGFKISRKTKVINPRQAPLHNASNTEFLGRSLPWLLIGGQSQTYIVCGLSSARCRFPDKNIPPVEKLSVISRIQ